MSAAPAAAAAPASELEERLRQELAEKDQALAKLKESHRDLKAVAVRVGAPGEQRDGHSPAQLGHCRRCQPTPVKRSPLFYPACCRSGSRRGP